MGAVMIHLNTAGGDPHEGIGPDEGRTSNPAQLTCPQCIGMSRSQYGAGPFEPLPTEPQGISGGRVALIVIAVVIAFCGIGTLVAVLTGGENANKAARIATVPDRGTVPTIDAPAPLTPSAPKVSGLRAADVKLSVKVTSKECFGSAGCNVEWDVKAGWDEGKIALGGECDVTYEVRGLSDPQIGTLTIRDDGQYLSDSFNFGQTRKRSDKLTVKVTEVECR